MRKMVVAVAALLVLTGCSTDERVETEQIESVQEAQTTPFAHDAEASTVDATAPGEVCDPGNANDAICAAFYPAQAADNMLARQKEPLASMSREEQQELIEQACDAMDQGETWETAILVEEPNLDERAGYPATNQSLYSVASYGQCQEHVTQVSGYGNWLINYYQGIGEEAAKAEFSDGSMPDSIPDNLKPGAGRME